MKSINCHVVAGLDNCSRFLQLMGLAKILTSHPQYRMSHFRIYGTMVDYKPFVVCTLLTALCRGRNGNPPICPIAVRVA